MAIPYKKQFVKSDGRKLNRSGPRDMQARAVSTGVTDLQLIEVLTNQITELKAEILAMKSKVGDAVPTGFFSPEQVDEEIRRAVKEAVAETTIALKSNGKDIDLVDLVKEYKEQIVELQKGQDNLKILHSTIAKENGELKKDNAKLRDALSKFDDLKKQIAVLEQELEGKKEIIEIMKSRPAIIDGEVVDPNRPQMEQVFVDPLDGDAGKGMKASIKIDNVSKEGEVESKVDKLRDLLGKKLPKD